MLSADGCLWACQLLRKLADNCWASTNAHNIEREGCTYCDQQYAINDKYGI